MILDHFQGESLVHFPGNIQVKNCEGKGLVFSGKLISGLKILDCKRFQDSSISAKINKNIEMKNTRFQDISFGMNNKIINLIIKNCDVSALDMSHTEMNGENIIINSTIHGFDLSKAIIKNLRLENVTIMGYIAIENSVLENLVLKKIQYAPGKSTGIFKLYNGKVKYKNSKKFPIKGAVIKGLDEE